MSRENDRANGDAEALASLADIRSENDGSWTHFVRALTCCRSIDEATAGFVAAATGFNTAALPWGEMIQRLVESGRFVPAVPGALEVVPTMVVAPGGGATRETSGRREIAMLLDHWCNHPGPDLLTEAVLWATQIEAWGQLQWLWSEYLCTEDLAHRPQAAHAMALIPEQVRRHFPLLTAATGASRAVDLSGSARTDAMIDFAARDAMDLHSRWETLEDTDAATLAGTLWMICQRYMPQGTPGREADSSWDTRNEIITFLDHRRHEDKPASPWALAFFRAASAQLAFIRADLITSFTDSGIVEVVDDGFHFRDLLSGTRRLTLALTGSDPGAVVETEPRDAMTPGAWQGEIREEALVTSWLADALLRLRRLESSGPGGWLGTMPESSRNSPLWTAFAWAEATAEGLWCDPSEALAHLDDRIGEHAVQGTEHRQPFGVVALGRARSMLLVRRSAFSSAMQVAAGLPAPWNRVPSAMTLLWAGDLEGAIHAAAKGIYDQTTRQPDRLRLEVIRAEAMLHLAPDSDEARQTAATSVQRCLQVDNLLAFAELPELAREELVGAWMTQATEADALMVSEKLSALTPDKALWGPVISLTRREQVLLPLLATSSTAVEIADGLSLSVTTVRSQIATLRAKFAAGSRSELVSRAKSAGFLD